MRTKVYTISFHHKKKREKRRKNMHIFSHLPIKHKA